MIWLVLACNQGTEKEQEQSSCTIENYALLENDTIVLPEEACQSLSLNSRLLGDGTLSLRWEQQDNQLRPIVSASGEATFHGLVLNGSYTLRGENDTRLWKQGYQSWWWSGITDLVEPEYDSYGIPLVGGDDNGTSATNEKPYSSWWLGLVGKEEGDSLLVGALSATRTRVWSAFTDTEAWFVWGHRGDEIALSDGEELLLDPLWIKTHNDAFELHLDYAKAAAQHHEIEERNDKPPIGWATWYTFYSEIDEQIIRENLVVAEELAQNPDLEPMTVFQIDDGWQRTWGDWQANEHFPSGMAQLAEDIQNAGFTPGLWMAPFYVSTSAPIFSEHDDWWVLDAQGEPITYSNLGTGDYAIVDVTHPDAGPWMRDQIARHKEAGWTYLKLDFLYAGAQRGQRYQDVTGMEAFHIGMNYLKEAYGDAFVLACGAPMLPSLGYADAFRTGADIGFDFDPGPRHEYLRWQTRATMARSWQNKIWWWVDPDQMLLRDPFDEPKVQGSIVANLLSGGSWLIGDDLRTVQRERLEQALRKDILAKTGQIVRPINPLAYPSGPDIGPVSELSTPNDQISPRWQMEDGTELLINMSDRTLEIQSSGGTEMFSASSDTQRSLRVGEGEIWNNP